MLEGIPGIKTEAYFNSCSGSPKKGKGVLSVL